MKRRSFIELLLGAPALPKLALRARVAEKAEPPAYSFTNDSNTGLYRPESGSIKIVVGGRDMYIPYYK